MFIKGLMKICPITLVGWSKTSIVIYLYRHNFGTFRPADKTKIVVCLYMYCPSLFFAH